MNKQTTRSALKQAYLDWIQICAFYQRFPKSEDKAMLWKWQRLFRKLKLSGGATYPNDEIHKIPPPNNLPY